MRLSLHFQLNLDLTLFLLNVFTALRGTSFFFYILFVIAAGVVLCGGHKKWPRTSPTFVSIVFLLLSVLLDQRKYAEKDYGFTLISSSWKHLHTKVTPDFHLTYSKNGGNLGSESK